jgi:uncharacterized protein
MPTAWDSPNKGAGMVKVSTRSEQAVQVEVSMDRLTATLWIDPQGAPGGAPLALVMARLEEEGIMVEQGVLKRLCVNGRVSTAGPTVVARGVAPVTGEAATLSVLEPTQFMDDFGRYTSVAQGTVVARLEGGSRGQDGRDVNGGCILAPRPTPEHELGVGLLQNEDGSVTAATEGRLAMTPGGVLKVLPVLSFEDSVGAGMLESFVDADVRIRGSLRDGLRLKVGGSVFISGAADCNELTVAEDLISQAGLLGTGARTGGMFVVGRNLVIRFATGVRLLVSGDARFSTDILNAEVRVGGALQVVGKIQGSRVLATAGLVCRNITNAKREITVVEVGYDAELMRMAEEWMPGLNVRMQRVEQGKQIIKPLVDRKDQLTPLQRAQAVRMIEENARLQQEVNQTTRALKRRFELAASRARAVLEVLGTVEAGVVVRFPGLEAEIRDDLRGPFTLTPGTEPGEPYLALTLKRNGEVRRVPAKAIQDTTVKLGRLMKKSA